jgi:tetratricopeptide (TPR) repeat protein
VRRFLAFFWLFSATLTRLSAEEFLTIPFTNNSGISGLDWIGESTSEAFRDVLVTHGFSVVGREEREEMVQRLNGSSAASLSRAALLKLAETLDCGYIVYGELGPGREETAPSFTASRVRLTARLVDMDKFAAVLTLEEEGALDDLSVTQGRLALRLLRHLRPEQAPAQEEFMARRPRVRTEAVESYVRGLQTPNPQQKHRYFTQAVRLDQEFSEPCYQLGLMQWEERMYRVAAEWLEKVKPYDAHYLEANFLLGLCRYHLGDTAGAVAAFVFLAQTRPTSEVWNNLGVARLRHNDPEAWGSLWNALDEAPGDPDYQFNAGYLLWKYGDLKAAEERFRQVLKIDPGDVDAQLLLDRCINRHGPRRGDLSGEGLERLKENYQSAAKNQRNAGKSESH